MKKGVDMNFKLLLLLVLLASCKSTCQKSHKESVDNSEKGTNVPAIVNDIELNGNDLDTLHKRAVDQFSRTGRPVSAQIDRNIRASILKKMIDDEIFKQKAKETNIMVDRIERV